MKNNKRNGTSRNNKQKEKKQNNIIIDCAKTTPFFVKFLNQFICEECFHLNPILEDRDKKTEIYSETKQPCNYCSKKTMQICVGDRELTKAILEISANNTSEQEKALQIIKKSRSRKNK